MRRSASSISTSTSPVDQRADVDLGEAGVAARGGVEGRDPDQPVDAALGGEEAVGVLAAGDEGRRLQARLLPRRGLLHLDLEAAPLGPAQVHPQQDLGPVLGVGAAGAGVDGDDGVAGVVLAAEQPRLLELGQAALDRAELRARARRPSPRPRRPSRPARRGRRRRTRARGTSPGGAARGRARPRSCAAVSWSSQKPGSLHLLLEALYLGLERSRVKGSPRAGTAARGQRRGAARSLRWSGVGHAARLLAPVRAKPPARSASLAVLERAPAERSGRRAARRPRPSRPPRRLAVLRPVPAAHDQRHRAPAAASVSSS